MCLHGIEGYGLTGRQTNRQTDRKERQTQRKVDKKTDRKTERETADRLTYSMLLDEVIDGDEVPAEVL